MSDINWNRFLDFIQKEEHDLKVQAIDMLPKLINEKTIDKFVGEITSFLVNIIDEEEDVILQGIYKNFPLIINCIKNNSSSKKDSADIYKNLDKLLPYIENGLISYSSILREDSVEAYKLLLKEYSNSYSNSHLPNKESNKTNDCFELIFKFSNSINHKSRIAFITILPNSYRLLNSSQKSRISSFIKQFSYEGNDYIKKCLIISIKQIASYLNEDTITTIINNLIQSNNESIRIPIMDCIANLKNHPNLSNMEDLINKSIMIIGKDESWRVRYTLANNIINLLSFNTFNSTLKKDIIKYHCSFLNDNEMEIRSLSIKNTLKIIEIIQEDEENVNNIVMAFEKEVLNETEIDIKEVISDNIISIVKYLSKNIIKNIIIPLIHYLLKEANIDSIKSKFIKPSRESLSSSSKDLVKKVDALNKSPSPEKRKLPNSAVNSPGVNNSFKQRDKRFNSGNFDKSKLSINPTEGNSVVYDNSGECNRNLNVQLKIIKNMQYLSKYYPSLDFEIEIVNNLNCIYASAMWKTKSLLIQTITDLVNSNYFSKSTILNDILAICLKAIQDNVYNVRESAMNCLTSVLIAYQSDVSIENKLFQELEKLISSDAGFRKRNSYALFMLNIVKNNSSSEALINNYVLPIAIDNISTDRVGSIRLIAAKIIFKIININKKFYTTKVKACLNNLSKDNDYDVKSLVLKGI